MTKKADKTDKTEQAEEMVGPGWPEGHDELEKDIPKLKVVKLRDVKECSENKKRYVRPIKGLNFKDVYCVVGEVSDIRHYVVMNLRTGRVLNGMFHLTRFRAASDEEL